MKLHNIKEVNEFMAAADKCNGGVRLESPYGDVYNLKSKLSQFVAVGELLKEYGDELELFCDDPNDEKYFFKFFNENPGVVHDIKI